MLHTLFEYLPVRPTLARFKVSKLTMRVTFYSPQSLSPAWRRASLVEEAHFLFLSFFLFFLSMGLLPLESSRHFVYEISLDGKDHFVHDDALTLLEEETAQKYDYSNLRSITHP